MENNFFTANLAEVDPIISEAIDDEVRRQSNGLELIASENFVSEAVLQRGEKNRHIRLRSRMRLNIRVFRPENLFRAVNRQLLDDISKLAAAIISFLRITFGVFVRKNRTHRL